MADTGGISANDAERFLFREERVDHVEKIRIRRKILRQRYVQVRFVRLRDAYSRAGGHVHVPRGAALRCGACDPGGEKR